MTIELYLQFWAKIISIWWPVFFSAGVGLAYLSYTERRDKLMAIEVTLVRKEDLESLVNTLEINIQALENREIDNVIESLKKLKNNIEMNLEGGSLNAK